jgi:hypothetical protein
MVMVMIILSLVFLQSFHNDYHHYSFLDLQLEPKLHLNDIKNSIL